MRMTTTIAMMMKMNRMSTLTLMMKMTTQMIVKMKLMKECQVKLKKMDLTKLKMRLREQVMEIRRTGDLHGLRKPGRSRTSAASIIKIGKFLVLIFVFELPFLIRIAH
jgi:hypothetical protein